MTKREKREWLEKASNIEVINQFQRSYEKMIKSASWDEEANEEYLMCKAEMLKRMGTGDEAGLLERS